MHLPVWPRGPGVLYEWGSCGRNGRPRRLADTPRIGYNHAVTSDTEQPIPAFTLEQIDDIHARLGSAQTLDDYVRALRSIGVARYDSFVADGHSEFFDAGGAMLATPPAHVSLEISTVVDVDAARAHLDRHGLGETAYLEMSQGLADSGIERWTVDTAAMTMTFRDGQGNDRIVDKIT